MAKHKSAHKESHAKGGHHAASHRVSDSHSFKDHNPYVLSSMYAKRVESQNKKFAATRVAGSRDDYSVPSHMHGATSNAQHPAKP